MLGRLAMRGHDGRGVHRPSAACSDRQTIFPAFARRCKNANRDNTHFRMSSRPHLRTAVGAPISYEMWWKRRDGDF